MVRFCGVIVLIAKVISSQRKLVGQFEICTCEVSGLYEPVKPKWLRSDVQADRRVRNRIVNLQPVSYGWSYIPGFNMMADLQSGSERAFKVVDLPMKSHVGEISEIESSRKGIQEIHLHL